MAINAHVLGVIQAASYIVLAGSALQASTPAPIADVATSKEPKWKKTIFGSTAYKVLYRLLKICSLNVGWARNFADPKQIQKYAALISAVTAASASVSSSDDSSTSSTPTVESVKLNGDIVVKH